VTTTTTTASAALEDAPPQLTDSTPLPDRRYTCPQQPNLQIPTSRLSDTICDCCDGSDEPPTVCPDTCEVVLAAERRARAELQLKFLKGYRSRLLVAKEYERRKEEVAADMALVKDMVIPDLETEIASAEGAIEELRQHWVQERRRAMMKNGEKLGFLGLLSVEEMTRLVVGVCQLVGEAGLEGGDSDECLTLKVGAFEMGWYWDDDTGVFDRVDDNEEKKKEGMLLLQAVVFDENIYNASKSGNKKQKKKKKKEAEQLEDFEFDEDDDNDYEDSHDYDEDEEDDENEDNVDIEDNDIEDNVDIEDEVENEDEVEKRRKERYNRAAARAARLKEAKETNEEETEPKEKIFGVLSRQLFKDYAEDVIAKIDALLTENEDEKEDEDNDGEGDNEETDAEQEGEEEEAHEEVKEKEEGDSPLSNTDPIAIQSVRRDLQTRLDQIKRGEQYAKSASERMSAVLSAATIPSLEDIIDLTVAIVYHSKVTTSDITEILFAILPEYQEQFETIDVCSTTGTSTQAAAASTLEDEDICTHPTLKNRYNRPFPPESFVTEYLSRCRTRITSATCPSTADPSSPIPQTTPPNGYLGYYTPTLSPIDLSNIDPLYEPFHTQLHALNINARFPQKVKDVEKLKRDLRDNEEKVKDMELQVDDDYNGSYGELSNLTPSSNDGTPLCEELTTGQYTYQVCFFDKAYQRDKGTKEGGTSLGNWEKTVWDEGNGSVTFYYTGGQKCWNGPKRSVEVRVTCGGEGIRILAAEEPEMCSYLIHMEGYFVCNKKFAESEDLIIPDDGRN